MLPVTTISARARKIVLDSLATWASTPALQGRYSILSWAKMSLLSDGIGDMYATAFLDGFQAGYAVTAADVPLETAALDQASGKRRVTEVHGQPT
jgi:hypothetical protein